MLEIIGGIIIGFGIETFGLISYIYYKRRKLKPYITYNEAFDVNIQPDETINTNVDDHQVSIEYNDL